MVMVERTSGSGSGIYFIVGALVVAVLVIGYFVFGGSFGRSDKVNITIEPPKATAPK